MSKKPSESEAARRARFAAAARERWPVAKGSLAHVARPCGRPQDCPACRSGRRHPMWIFTFRQAGRLRCRYVPEACVEGLRRALQNGRDLEARLVEEGAAFLERLRRAHAQKKG